MKQIKMKLVLCSVLSLIFLFNADLVLAATPEVKIRDEAFSAKFVSQSINDPVEIEAGKSKIVVFKFKNIGTATWPAKGTKYISAYTMEPRDRVSVFKGKSWVSGKQTNGILTAVSPGGVGELSIEFVAPTKAGEYMEKFYLAAENYSWVKGGYFYVKIKVVPASSVSFGSPAPTPTSMSEVVYKAKRFAFNLKDKTITVAGGEKVKVFASWQNLGATVWQKYAIISGPSSALAGTITKLALADESWKSADTVVDRSKIVESFGVVSETFDFRAPLAVGNYTAQFNLVADGKVVDEMYLPVTVTANAPNYVSETNINSNYQEEVVTIAPRLSEEPRIRVGLWKPEGAVQFVSYEEDYQIYSGQNLKGVLSQKKIAVLSYNKGQYSFKGDGVEFSGIDYIRLVPVNNPHAIFTLYNFDRKVTWKGPDNFNKYRGVMEYRLTKDSKTLYVINDLLLEDYVAGDGETSNGAPIEYIKAMQVAYRTYAYYLKEYADKHEERNFDVVANTGDQLYLGYVSEALMPNVLKSAQETRGNMVTYDNNIVITPYYANSDGRTRAWTEVWGGSVKPWLVSVKAEYDKGKKMLGHGVGMSARDAAYRADAGVLWQDLIKHYYSGVGIEKIYN